VADHHGDDRVIDTHRPATAASGNFDMAAV
jgi:hypothetical protein